jgi:hypothetical protein
LQKAVHPIAEIATRSIRAAAMKIQCGLVSASTVASNNMMEKIILQYCYFDGNSLLDPALEASLRHLLALVLPSMATDALRALDSVGHDKREFYLMILQAAHPTFFDSSTAISDDAYPSGKSFSSPSKQLPINSTIHISDADKVFLRELQIKVTLYCGVYPLRALYILDDFVLLDFPASVFYGFFFDLVVSTHITSQQTNGVADNGAVIQADPSLPSWDAFSKAISLLTHFCESLLESEDDFLPYGRGVNQMLEIAIDLIHCPSGTSYAFALEFLHAALATAGRYVSCGQLLTVDRLKLRSLISAPLLLNSPESEDHVSQFLQIVDADLLRLLNTIRVILADDGLEDIDEQSYLLHREFIKTFLDELKSHSHQSREPLTATHAIDASMVDGAHYRDACRALFHFATLMTKTPASEAFLSLVDDVARRCQRWIKSYDSSSLRGSKAYHLSRVIVNLASEQSVLPVRMPVETVLQHAIASVSLSRFDESPLLHIDADASWSTLARKLWNKLLLNFLLHQRRKGARQLVEVSLRSFPFAVASSDVSNCSVLVVLLSNLIRLIEQTERQRMLSSVAISEETVHKCFTLLFTSFVADSGSRLLAVSLAVFDRIFDLQLPRLLRTNEFQRLVDSLCHTSATLLSKSFPVGSVNRMKRRNCVIVLSAHPQIALHRISFPTLFHAWKKSDSWVGMGVSQLLLGYALADCEASSETKLLEMLADAWLVKAKSLSEQLFVESLQFIVDLNGDAWSRLLLRSSLLTFLISSALQAYRRGSSAVSGLLAVLCRLSCLSPAVSADLVTREPAFPREFLDLKGLDSRGMVALFVIMRNAFFSSDAAAKAALFGDISKPLVEVLSNFGLKPNVTPRVTYAALSLCRSALVNSLKNKSILVQSGLRECLPQLAVVLCHENDHSSTVEAVDAAIAELRLVEALMQM